MRIVKKLDYNLAADNDLLFMEPTLSPCFAGYVENYIYDLGGDPKKVLGDNWVYCQSSEDNDLPIPLSRVVELFQQTKKFSGEQHLGLALVQHYRYEAAAILIMLVLAAPDVKTAVSALCQHDKQVDLAIKTQFRMGARTSSFSYDIANPLGLDVTLLSEFLLAFILDILEKGTRKTVPIKELWLVCDKPAIGHKLENYYAVPIKYEQPVNKVIFDSAFLGEKFKSANKLLFKVLRDTIKTYYTPQVNHGGYMAEVCARIVTQSSDASPTIDDVATSLAISSRTLGRRLVAEGTSFQQVKKTAREQLARALLLNTSASISEIAFRLGYSELSAFSRAFSSWVGITPHEYRIGAS